MLITTITATTTTTLVKARMSAAVIARKGGRREASCQCTEPPTCHHDVDGDDDDVNDYDMDYQNSLAEWFLRDDLVLTKYAKAIPIPLAIVTEFRKVPLQRNFQKGAPAKKLK